jgi:iron(III) transport system ATP-binding protein
MLTVTGLGKRYDEQSSARRYAIRDVSFEVAEGEFFTLLGPSGCGKTTLLRCVAGLETPTTGEIGIDGATVSSPARNILLKPERRPIGMVFQSYAIWPHMTVFDNAAFPLLRGQQRLRVAQARPIVEDLLERVGLAQVKNAMATRLSGGQQQRLALARALAARPKVLLLDEPLSNVDAALRATLRQEVKAIQREFGITTLYVTHDQAEALSMSDRIAVLSEGTVRQIGTPRQVYFSPSEAFVARTVGAANVIEGRVADAGHGAIIDSEIGVLHTRTTLGHPVGAVLTCFVRPENVRVIPRGSQGDAPGAVARQDDDIVGTIVAHDFVGGHQECVVRVGDVELRGWADPAAEFTEGAEALIEFAVGAVMVLAPEEAARAGSPSHEKMKGPA